MLSGLLSRFKAWRKRRYWQRRHIEFVRTMVQQDHRWLAEFAVADELTNRYLAALSDTWYQTNFEDVSQFRERLRQSARLAAAAHRDPPTLEQCYAAGRGPDNGPGVPYREGGLPNTPEERARFEAYMRGHYWAIGTFDEELNGYDTLSVRCLYGVWRDRGAIDAGLGSDQ